MWRVWTSGVGREDAATAARDGIREGGEGRGGGVRGKEWRGARLVWVERCLRSSWEDDPSAAAARRSASDADESTAG